MNDKERSQIVISKHTCNKNKIMQDTNSCILPRQEGSRAINFVKLASNQVKEIEK